MIPRLVLSVALICLFAPVLFAAMQSVKYGIVPGWFAGLVWVSAGVVLILIYKSFWHGPSR